MLTFALSDEPMKWEEMKLRAEDDYSVDMEVTDCGICGSKSLFHEQSIA